MARSFFAVALTCALGATAFAGPDWIEHGDAGSFLNTAQGVLGVGQLETIHGSTSSGLLGADLEDMYLIRITEPATFSFSLTANFNSAVWLFNVTLANQAYGLLSNDDGPSSIQPLLTGTATDATMVVVTNPGTYALAITGSGHYPTSLAGALFNVPIPTEISGPDGPGGILPHSGWAGVGSTGTYDVTVTGVNYVDTPAPGTIAASVMGLGLFGARRRR